MNFTPIFNLQKKLDLEAYTEPILTDAFFKEKRIVALLVEIGELGSELELANSPTNVIKSVKLLEEFVDGLHFISSMANEMNLDPHIDPLVSCGEIACQLVAMFEAAVLLKYNYNAQQLYQVLANYLGLAKLLKISNAEIVSAHKRKHLINRERRRNNY